MNVVIILLSNILFPLVTVLIYGAGGGFYGWNFYEVLCIQAIFTISTGIADVLFQGVLWKVMYNIVDGTFDVLLLRPINILVYLIASSIQIENLGLVMGGIAMFVFSLYNLAAPNALGWLAFFLLFLAGLLIMFGIMLFMTATSFRWISNSRIPEIFDSIKSFGKYPQGIFPKAITLFTSFIMPVAMIAFFPASALLGRLEPWMYLSIIPCFLFAVAGIIVFHSMVKSYEGAGG